MGLEYEHDEHCFIAWKFLNKIFLWHLVLSMDRPGFSFKREVTILELWYGMAAEQSQLPRHTKVLITYLWSASLLMACFIHVSIFAEYSTLLTSTSNERVHTPFFGSTEKRSTLIPSYDSDIYWHSVQKVWQVQIK